MKVLWVGDAVVSTGFARCTHKVCDYLYAQGHEIYVLGINYTGDPHTYPYTIYPCVNHYEGCHSMCGEDRLPKLILKLRPDVVFILQDPWNIKGYYEALDEYFESLKRKRQLPDDDFLMPAIVGWLAVDAKNQISGVECNQLDHIITWTQFGIDELRAGGYTGPSSIIPLGVDSQFYADKGKLESREKYLPESVPRGAFVVGTVGSNQYRKRLDLLIEYFAHWTHTHDIDDAYLYIHIGPTGERAVNIPALCKYYGLSGKVIVAMPPVGSGRDEQDMPYVYSLMDVFVTMTQGEGWGLPVLEAMACGLPCVVPQWSGLGEWTKDVAVQVPCTTYALNSPLNNWPYTIGGIADRDETVRALDLLYRSQKNGSISVAKAQSRQLAESLSWNTVGKKFQEFLSHIARLKEAA